MNLQLNGIIRACFILILMSSGKDLGAGTIDLQIKILKWGKEIKKFENPKNYHYRISNHKITRYIGKVGNVKVYFTCKIVKTVSSMGRSAEVQMSFFDHDGHTVWVNPGMSATTGGVVTGWNSPGVGGFEGFFKVLINKSEIYPKLKFTENSYQCSIENLFLLENKDTFRTENSSIKISDTTGKYTKLYHLYDNTGKIYGFLLYTKKLITDGVLSYKVFFSIYQAGDYWELISEGTKGLEIRDADPHYFDLQLDPVYKVEGFIQISDFVP